MKKLILLLSLTFTLNAFASSGKTVLLVEGMTCASCAGSIEKHLKRVEGVSSVNVSIKSGKVTITQKENTKLDPAKAKKAVEDAGYKVILVESAPQSGG